MVTKNAGLFYLRYFFFRCVKFSYEFGTSHKTVVALTVLPGKAKRKVSSEISSWTRLRNRFVTIQRRPFCFLKQIIAGTIDDLWEFWLLSSAASVIELDGIREFNTLKNPYLFH